MIKSTSWKTTPVAVLDFEMTGLDPRTDRICEVAVLTAVGEHQEGIFQQLLNPLRPIPLSAVRVHGITTEMVQDKPTFSEVGLALHDLLQGRWVIGHRIEHDLSFWAQEMKRAHLPCQELKFIDTMQWSKRWLSLPKNGLRAICEQLGISENEYHRALFDAKATYALWLWLCSAMDPHGTKSVSELQEGIDYLGPHTPFRKQQKQLLEQAKSTKTPVWIDYPGSDVERPYGGWRKIEVLFVGSSKIRAFCRFRNAERVFRLERIRAVSLTLEQA